MDRQAIFDTVVEGARKQKRRSTGTGYDSENGGFPKTVCRFRSEDFKGEKCFIGMLIPDEMYNREMEKGGVGVLISKYPEFKKLIGFEGSTEDSTFVLHNEDFQFLDDLRLIHDREEVKDWEGKFFEFAFKYRLNFVKM